MKIYNILCWTRGLFLRSLQLLTQETHLDVVRNTSNCHLAVHLQNQSILISTLVNHKTPVLLVSCISSNYFFLLLGNERAIIWFLLFEFVIIVLFAALVRFCFIFWKKQKLQGRPFSVFLDKRVSKP